MLTETPIEENLPPHGISVIESRHHANFFMPWRTDSFAKILLPLAGSGRLIEPERTTPIAPNSLILIPAGSPHRLEDAPGHPVWLLGLCLDPRQAWWDDSANTLFSGVRCIANGASVEKAHTTLRRVLYEQSDRPEGWKLMQTGLCASLLAELLRLKVTHAELSSEDRVKRYISEMEHTFYLDHSIDDVSQRLGLGRRRFTDLFRQLTGTSWLQTVRKQRIDHASQLLRETNRSTKAIAYECGFDNPSQFFRSFRKIMGTTPKQYQLQHRQAASSQN